MKKILITGGAGFLGSHLCEKFLNKNFYIYCLDNLYTGRKKNIEKFLDNKNFEFIKHNINEPIHIKVDYILNFACPASPIHYQLNPIETFKTSSIGVMNLLELAKKTGAVFFQASTSEIYGDSTIHPQNEEYWGNVNPIGIRSCYDEGKRCAETLCFDYHRELGVKIKVIRIFNTYGPNMDLGDGRVISNFICQALKNENITIYGDGNQTRSFQYVDDLIEGIYKMLLESPDDFTGPVNLGNTNEFTILELAKKIISITGSKSKLVFEKLPGDDPRQRNPDISLAKKVLNWEAKTQLNEGLNKTSEYFKGEI